MMRNIKKRALILTLALAANCPAHALDYEDLTLYQFAKIISEKLEYTILFSPRVRTNKKTNLLVGEKFDHKKLYSVFLSVLNAQGYTAIRTGKIVRVVQERKARSMAYEN